MIEIVRISLDNEMDLILAHKRTLKLAELCGLSLSSQTTFATAVSEIARCAISFGDKSHLILAINSLKSNKKELVARILDMVNLGETNSDAFSYAKRLMGDLHSVKEGDFFEIKLKHNINFSGTISPAKIESFKEYFTNEPPISPYDEIRKKNIQLIDLSNKLKESEQQYKVLTDTLPLMMFSLNKKGEVTYSNQWLKDFFGNNGSSIGPSAWSAMLHKDDLTEVHKNWEKCQQEKIIFRSEGRMKHKDGKYIWHLISIVPLKHEGEKPISWIGFFADIDSQKNIEEALKDNQELKDAQNELRTNQRQLELKIKELNTSNKNLEEFAFIASHDLQEPLRKIRTYSNLLEKDLQLSDKQNTFFSKIRKSSDRMSRLITDVLNYSQVSSRNTTFEDTDLNEIMSHVLDDIELLVQERGAKIRVEGLPVVKALPLQMSQLFSNLIQNAIKFSGDTPEINISASKLTREEVGEIRELNPAMDYIKIKFQDNGVGFEPKYAEKIFVIFQRLNDIESSGTGIGLALCRKIVENHHGYINATSNKDNGATFNIFLPDSAHHPDKTDHHREN